MKRFAIATAIFSTLLLASVTYAAGPGTNWFVATPVAPWAPRMGHTSLFSAGKLWVFGGMTTSNQLRNDAFSSPASGPTAGTVWTQVRATSVDPNMWTPRFTAASVEFNNRMWVMGGADSSFQILNDVWSSADNDGVNWTEATEHAAWSTRQGMAVTVHNDGTGDKMYLAGGLHDGDSAGTQFLNDVWSSADGATWTQLTANAPWTPRRYEGLVSFNGKLWMLGGMDSRNNALNDVWNSTDGVTWTQVTAHAPWTERGQHQVVVAEGRIWVLGGLYMQNNDDTTEVHLNDVWSSADGVTWTQATAHAQWSGREDHTALFANGKLWVLGGGVNVATDGDVWYSRIANMDTITITKAKYEGNKLAVEAQSTEPNGTASLFLQNLDTMTYNPKKNIYTFLGAVPNPGTISVLSTFGGDATAAVR